MLAGLLRRGGEGAAKRGPRSAGEVRAARVAGRAGWAGCARRGARECGPARTEGEAGDWAVREGVARSGPGRWVGGVKGWAGVGNGPRGEG